MWKNWIHDTIKTCMLSVQKMRRELAKKLLQATKRLQQVGQGYE